jgi:hypothetical protein
VSWTTRTIKFEEVTRGARKNLPCPDCGKKVRRQITFSQTINPWNKNAAGEPKTWQEIQEELKADVAKWAAKPVQCKSCRDASEGGAE